jgi:integrase/recombinase XerC
MNKNRSLTPLKYLNSEEEQHFESMCEKLRTKEPRNSTMLLFMLKTGCRPGEMIRLTWGDIDWSSKTVYVRTLKNGPPRVIPLRQQMMGRLKEMGPGDPSALIFGISYNRFREIWAEWRPVKKNLHCLRHTFAVNLYKRSKFNHRLVQQALGHNSIQTTSIYLQIEESMTTMRNALD